ncbi:MAG: YhdP family protein [Tepidimonas sp.]|uniref:YhdP family protein n=1 Tax=Tepidimonas sp. TaxID=2002775 RepID=UPI00298F1997|nr:YhdP family protein [Tepidimonas sp.]MDW8336031.1 YhdP family protein [Tepidimonas sp.]
MTPTLIHPPAPWRWRALAAAARWLLAAAVAWWCALLLVWGALQWWIVPRVDAWRGAVEAAATRALGVRTTLQRLEVTHAGLAPQIALHGLQLHDAQGRVALSIPLAWVTVSPRSLLTFGVEQLVIDGLDVQVRRLADGRILVAGLEVGAATDDSALADWLFAQREVVLRGGRVQWIDERRPAAEPLVLTEVLAVARNPGWRHELRVDATPPPQWGQGVSWRARFKQPPWQLDRGDWRRWSGPWFLSAERLDAALLAQVLDLGPWGLQALAGQGALRAWGELRAGQWVALTADVHLQDVRVRWSAPAQAPLALADARGRIEVRREGDTLQWSTQGLTLRGADGAVWPQGDLRLSYTLQDDGRWRAWSLQADRLDLDMLQRLGRVLPLGQASAWLEQLRPRGVAQGLQLRWQAGPRPGEPSRWSGRGRVQGLALAAGEPPPDHPGAWGRPGIDGVQADFTFDERGGQATLALRRGGITLPGGFEEPRLAFDELQAQARWRVEGPHLELEVPSLQFANADAEGRGQLRWRTADPSRSGARDRFPGELDLDVRLTRAEGPRVVRYLPLTVGANTRAYLKGAIRAGRASDVRLRVRGDLWDFPFAQPQQGLFEVVARLHDVTLDYVPAHLRAPAQPAWPALERLEGQLRIERTRLEIRDARGSVVGLPQLRALQTRAVIPDYLAEHVQLQVQGLVRGPAPEALRFVAQSPVQGYTGGALDGAQASGNLEVALELNIPLDHVDQTRVRGQLRLAGNDLQFGPDAPWLREVRGTLDFTEQGFRVPQASARLLGGELRFSGGMAAGDAVRLQGQGTVSAAGLRASREWAWARWLGARAQGETTYAVTLQAQHGAVGVEVDTDLRGLALDLPAPLTKPAEASWRTQVALQPLPRQGTAARDRLRVQVQADALPRPGLLAEYERESQGSDVAVRRGRLALGAEPPPWPDEGVRAALRVPLLDLDGWQAVVPTSEAGSGSLADEPARAYWPTRFGVAVEQLRWGGRSFEAVSLEGRRSADLWRLQVAARQIDGLLEVEAGAAPRVVARLSRLRLPAGTEAEVERLAAQPRALPALNVVVDDFELAGRALGRLEVQASHREAAQGGATLREWRLDSLQLTLPEARLSARGQWAPTAALTAPGQAASARRTALQLRLDIDDAGALLERFGWAGALRGGRGRLEGSLGWIGSPLALHIPTLSGELELDVQRGQFLKADPGLAKLLGLLSLQSLPRRLTLDFRDVFSEGFAFDSVRGHVTLARGVASTRNLQMRGVSAAALMEGSADLVRETADLTVVVVPELNAGTASLLAAVVNPVTGLGTFLAQLVLRQPLQAAATQTFRITGRWDDPQVDRVARTIAPADNAAHPTERTP